MASYMRAVEGSIIESLRIYNPGIYADVTFVGLGGTTKSHCFMRMFLFNLLIVMEVGVVGHFFSIQYISPIPNRWWT